MSGIEVVAAVSAIISAFHGGSELLQHIKQKRRARKARDQAQQDFEEKQLLDSLVSGEQQIGSRYTQDMREWGDLMRVGDVTARDRLFHIAIVLQAEVIKSLQLAAIHDNAILNLRLLHEASIMNRKDTLVALDELKQRILLTRPMARYLEGDLDGLRPRPSTASVQTNSYRPINSIPDNCIPSAVTLPAQADAREPKHGLSDYFRLKRKNSPATSPAPSTSVQAANINFSEALEQLVRSRGSEDRAVIMKDIDQMIGSYQGLHVNNAPSDSWSNNKYSGGYDERRDTLTMSYKQDPMNPNRDATRMFKSLPQPPEEYSAGSLSNHPAFIHNVLDPHQEQRLYNQQYAAKSPFSHLQAQSSPARWSDTSASSTNSEAVSPNRRGSDSSHGSFETCLPPSSMYSEFPSLSAPPNAPRQQYDEHYRVSSPRSAPHVPLEGGDSPTLAPLEPRRTGSQADALSPISPRTVLPGSVLNAFHEDTSSPMHMPWPGSEERQSYSPSIAPSNPPRQYPEAIQEDQVEQVKPSRARYHLLPPVARGSSSIRSNMSRRPMTPAAPATTPTSETVPPATASPRHASIAPSVASTESNGSGFFSSLSGSYMRSNKSGRPTTPAAPATTPTLGAAPATASLRHVSTAPSVASTDSNSSGTLGILPGARMRTIRTATIQSAPTGREKMMDGRPCKDNNYWGFCKGAWVVREDFKKGIALRTQPTGMYNTKQVWECTSCTFQGETFSAPHPTKKNKTETVVDQRVHVSDAGIRYRWIFLAKSHVKKKAGGSVGDETNYGCVICSAEGNVSSVYGGVETLMNHIALTHVADMSDLTRKKVNCILGRVADANEAFDINVPIFAPAEESAE